MNKLPLSLLLVVSMLSGTAFAYSDTSGVPANQQEAIQSLTDKGFIQGYADGTYRPTQHVNRAEFLKVLISASNWELVTNEDVACFKDFTGTPEWFWMYACSAKKSEVVSGYPDGTFRGSKYINIAEAMKIAANAFKVQLPNYFRAPDHWYDPYMDAMSGKGVFAGVRREPATLMTRAEMAFLINTLASSEDGTPACDGHALGESYRAPDGCNTCTCTANGPACTKMACKSCTSSNDCASGELCSTERGDCFSNCPPGQMCPAVCMGVCQKR